MFRRFRRRVGRRGPKLQIQRKAWITGVFNETAVTRDGNNNEFVIVTADDWQGDTANLTKLLHIKRIVITGGWCAIPESTTFAQDAVGAFAALYISDNDESTSSIITAAAGTILQGHRVLWTNAEGFTAQEIPSAQASDTYIPPVMRFNIDVRLNVVLKPDEELLLGMQFGSAVTGVYAGSNASLYTRVLVESP